MLTRPTGQQQPTDAGAYRQALNEVRALRPAQTPDEPPACCSGGRRGYQQHQRRGEPACEASKTANRLYMRDYLRQRRQTKKARDARS